jgi:hypothetical protein
LIIELLDLPLFDSAALSGMPHNACHDAIALRTYVLAKKPADVPLAARRRNPTIGGNGSVSF